MLIRPFALPDTDAVIALWEACGLTRPWNDPRPDRQGQGLGRAMLTEVETRLLRLGCPKLQFQVRPENTGVLGFYRALGYEPYDSVSAGRRLLEDGAG